MSQHHKDMQKFQISDRVLLRTLTIADAPKLFSLVDNNRDYLKQWLPWLDDNTCIENSVTFIQSTQNQLANNLGFQCGIFYQRCLVGMCGYHPIDRSNHSVTIGYWIAKEMMGKGIVTLCTQYLIDYAFIHLSINKVCIPVAEKNIKSRAISERLGLVSEGIERAAEYLYGRYVNHVRYSILKSEWEAL